MKNFFATVLLTGMFNYAFSQTATNCNCQVTITQSGYYDAKALNIKPGQTICIRAGTYSSLTFANLTGSSNMPITVQNCGGQVILKGSDNSSGITFYSSQYFSLSGVGDSGYTYGIRVQQTSGGVAAVNVSNLSTDFTLNHIEITGAGYAGIFAKTDPTCDPATWRQNFVMRNVSIHDNYIHDIDGKGILIGFNAGKVTKNCNGGSIEIYPHDSKLLKIYNNRIEKVGSEALIYANASNAEVYGNVIEKAGTKSMAAGVQIGVNAGGEFYNNKISGASGYGLSAIGYLGNNKVYNNIIANSGRHGVYVVDRDETTTNSPFLLANNTISGAGGSGIRLDNVKSVNTVINNAIVQSANTPMSVLAGVRVNDRSNYKGAATPESHFVNPQANDYHLTANSSLINAGESVDNFRIYTDLGGQPRTFQGTTDIGAYEYQKIVVAQTEPAPTPSDGCKLTITKDGYYDAGKLDINPGDKVCIQAGTYNQISIFNISGNKQAPVIVTNSGGLVVFDGASSPKGLALFNCKYFKLTGTGDPQHPYGIKVQRTESGVSGISVGNLSNYVEVEHVEVAGAGFAGIMIKTDPGCDPATWRENFTMREVKVHHNYIHDVGGEGIYVGNSFSGQGMTRTCNGSPATVYPHDILGLEIYENLTQRTGAEGIQYGSASDAEVHHNTILDPGISPFALYQDNGLQIGGGAGGRVYNNVIKNANGTGIIMIGHLGGNKIFNNLVIDSKGSGIFCDDRPGSLPNTPVLIANNTIYRSGSHGIYLLNEINFTTLINNVIMFPGSGHYIDARQGVPHADVNNFESSDDNNSTFANIGAGDFSPADRSPLIDAGADVGGYGIKFDLKNKKRPINNKYDIGAYEYGASDSGRRLAFEEFESSVAGTMSVYPSPCIDKLTIVLTDEDIIKKVEVITVTGKPAMRLVPERPTKEIEIEVSTLINGIYLAKVTTLAGKTMIRKFMKQ